MSERIEKDAMGEIAVQSDKLWGAQTQRSLKHFSIGHDRIPIEVPHAFAVVKKAAALLNHEAGRLDAKLKDAIVQAADEVISGKLDHEFPLYVWQTGSGTQSNMNVNEVISNRAIQILGGEIGSKQPVHPNDHVNMGQSSNDTFPTATSVAVVEAIASRTLPSLIALTEAIEQKSKQWMDVPKIGRTHLMDAVPLTVGQEWSGHAHQLRDAIAALEHARDGALELAVGGTAVGTGLNAPKGFSEAMAAKISELTGHAFRTAPNKFAALASADGMVRVSAALRGCAVALLKIANDMRLLASGPRSGIGELMLPENEPGSSIMPGKVNPTQCEAMVMIATRVIGNDATVAFAGAQGQFQLNTMRPLIADSVLHSARILADGCDRFRTFNVEGTHLRESQVAAHLANSVMLVTALAPTIGYDKASKIAHHAMDHGQSLRDAAIESGDVSAEDFDRIVDPMTMVGHGVAGA